MIYPARYTFPESDPAKHTGARNLRLFGWVPIQRWIPMAGISFFAGLILTAHIVAWLVQWLPYLIAGGMFIGALWTTWHFRSVIMGVKSGWNTPETAPNPPVIDKILKIGNK